MNQLNVPNWIATDGLRLLTNKMVIGSAYNTDYSKEFVRDFPIGESFAVPLPARFLGRRGLAYQPSDVKRLTTQVTVQEPFGIDFEFDSLEEALSTERGREGFRENYLDKAVEQIKQDIESALALYAYQNTPNIVGVLGTNPTTFDATSAAAQQAMQELAGWYGDRIMAIPPSVGRSVKTGAIGYFNPASDLSKQYREGSIGRADGFDWYTSMSLYKHTAGTWAGAVTVNGANQSGSAITITATAGDTFAVGDPVSFANVYAVNPMTRRTTGNLRTFAVTKALTAAGGGGDVLNVWPALVGPGDPNQNVTALPANSAALTLFPGTATPNGKSGFQGLALGPDAFLLCGIKLPVPKAVEMSAQVRDPNTGIFMRFVRAWNQEQSKVTNRLDVAIALGRAFADSCAVRVLCQ